MLRLFASPRISMHLALCVFVYLISMYLSSMRGYSKDNPVNYTPPLLKAPYTLVYDIKVEKAKPNESKPTSGKSGVIIIDNNPTTECSNGTVTISSNGNRITYIHEFGKRKLVTIVDKIHKFYYYYDNQCANAIISPGYEIAFGDMKLLPMPGVGYDFYPMLRSFRYSKTGISNGKMVSVGGFTSVNNGVVGDMVYQDAQIQANLSSGSITISSCKVPMGNFPQFMSETWDFADYVKLGSVQIAGSIDHVSYISSTPPIIKESEKIDPITGNVTYMRSVKSGPVKSVKVYEDLRYTLKSMSQSILPDAQYTLENYIPDKCIINDTRLNSQKPLVYYYDADNGTIDEQSNAAH